MLIYWNIRFFYTIKKDLVEDLNKGGHILEGAGIFLCNWWNFLENISQ